MHYKSTVQQTDLYITKQSLSIMPQAGAQDMSGMQCSTAEEIGKKQEVNYLRRGRWGRA